MGRPRETTCEEALEAVRQENGIVVDAAARIGCSPKTIYRRAKEDERIWEAIEEERDTLVRRLREVPKAIALDEDSEDRDRMKAAFKLLNVYDEDNDWSDRKSTDVTSGGEPVNDINLNVVTTNADEFKNEVREADERDT